ncbi:MAG TPA: lipocalin family protein [Oxalicibacterium sp.]|uniref:lipocalin family protein n=1 Tax=Oxalicibacterium sp. TaxID=2766525 RepID=UPI002CD1A083|nr:lipocalin family protein [Oxalicibacterium sp.]HWU99332.1 lipocalin family protein [Oxalicibacterium sp.]
MNRILMLGALCAACLFNSALAQDVRPVAKVDLDRYVGGWYEIARFPNRFQDQCSGNVTAEYSKRTDGEIEVVNRCKKSDGTLEEAIGRGRIVDAITNARLKVRFAPDWLGWIPFVWADYWIIDLADDYTYAAVGESSREYLWILSRTPTMSDATYAAIVNRLTEQGFDTAKLVKTRQTP